jgi:transposase InsO family protein
VPDGAPLAIPDVLFGVGNLLDTRTWETPAQLGAAIFEWIGAGYNPHHRHTPLGMLSPADYEHQSKTSALHAATEGAA